MLVGNIIKVHTCPGGKVLRKVKCTIGYNTSMVVNNKNQILLHLYFSSSGSVHSNVVAMDYSGYEMSSFIPKIDEDMIGQKIWLGGIFCDNTDNIHSRMCIG